MLREAFSDEVLFDLRLQEQVGAGQAKSVWCALQAQQTVLSAVALGGQT